MDPSDAARRLVKEQYVAVRQALTLLEERVLARYWDQDTPVRVGFGRFVGSLDEAAGRFLDDEDLVRRGQDLLRRTRSGTEAPTEPEAAAPAEPETAAPPEPETAAPAEPEATAPPEPEAPAPAEPEAPVPPVVPEPPVAGGPPSPAAEPGPGTVDVVFTLPAEVEADRVALCGEFNDWATDATLLERGGDGIWRATVALEPGRSYRYRYLLDGERWENAWQADQYLPNAYGSVDSVVVVE